MTKTEALQKLQQGETLTHTSFTDTEWVKQNKDGFYEYEDGNYAYPEQFWEYRKEASWEDGWSLFKPALPAIHEGDKNGVGSDEKDFEAWEKLIPDPIKKVLSDFAMDNTYPVRGFLRNLYRAATKHPAPLPSGKEGLEETAKAWARREMDKVMNTKTPFIDFLVKAYLAGAASQLGEVEKWGIDEIGELVGRFNRKELSKAKLTEIINNKKELYDRERS